MTIKWEVTNQAPEFNVTGKWHDLNQAVMDLEVGKWLKVTGFTNLAEVDSAQSSLGGNNGSRRMLREQGIKVSSHRHEMEVWITKYQIIK